MKYPEGVKAKFVLIDILEKEPRLLVDNHEPFGFHVHDGLPKNKSKRVSLNVEDHEEALEIFWSYVWKVLENEN